MGYRGGGFEVTGGGGGNKYSKCEAFIRKKALNKRGGKKGEKRESEKGYTLPYKKGKEQSTQVTGKGE